MKKQLTLEDYLTYLEKDRKKSQNTVEAYRRDILAFQEFLKIRGIDSFEEVDKSQVAAYLMDMKSMNKSSATVNRRLASIRGFYKYFISNEILYLNPAEDVKAPKIQRRELEYLTIEEVDNLLSMPDDSIKGKRDKAILEVMYATGIRAMEIIKIKLKDVNLMMGFITCDGSHGKARIVPMYPSAKKSLSDYIVNSRSFLMKNIEYNEEDSILFANYLGKPLTRQGLWKILKGYGEKAGLASKITPHILRNSFAVHMMQNGADIKTMHDLLGNEDLAATEVYLAVTKNEIKKVYDKTHPRA